MSTGFVLNIPQEMLNRLEDADKRIERLAKTSEDAQVRIVSAFQSINTHGIDAFINKLTEAQTKLSQLGSTQINMGVNANAFSGLATQAQNAIDEVNRVVAAIGKVKKVSGETGLTKNPFAGMSESLKDWNALQSKIDEADQKIKKLTSTTMDYERQMERIRSGQQIPVAISYNEYAYAKDKIAALQEEKKIYQEKQAEIIKQNNALADQVKLQNSLKQFVDKQNSLPEQRKRREYEAMRQMYIEDEKASETAEKKKIKDAETAEKERQKLREKRIREEEKAAERERKAYERMYKQLPSTITTKQAGQLVARSMDATSINQRLVAIKNLQAAVNNLDSTDKRYDQTVRKLNSEINRQKEELKKLGVEIDKVGKQHRSLMDISGQLTRKLALVFSVSQITGYVKKLIEVRGEFELQQRSLQAILQNKDEANRIWQQTVDLAVRSPFRVKELVSYTKQLAAYRIESDKLFETNKMLADISAGLGVDMQRLILAFGQVRSAAYLRGTELRQFTEAGIPILEQLAQYFTELEGRAVSVGDVFERVSKRMVSFADVEEIFKRMTSEGGTFFRMQEIQAETLRGQISNLKDSVDLMLNDIGKAHEGTLKNSVKFVRSLVENWEALTTAIKAVVAVLAMTKLNALLAKEAVMLLAIDMGILTNAAQTQLTITQLLKVGYMSLIKAIKGVGAAMKSLWVNNPWVLGITAVVVAVWKLVAANKAHKEAIEEVNKAFEENRNRMKKISVDFTYASGKGDLDTAKKKLSELIALANDEYSMNIEVNLKELNEEELKEYFVNLRQKMNEADSFAQTFVTEMQKFTEWTFTADITESASHLSSGATQYMNYLETASRKAIYALQEQERETGKLSGSMQEALNNIVPPQGVQEDALTYLERLEKGMKILESEAVALFNKSQKAENKEDKKYWKERYEVFKDTFLTPTMKGFGELTESSEFTFWSLTFEHQYKDFLDNLYVPSNMSDEDKRIYFTVAIDKAESQWGWNEFVRDYIERWTEERFEFEFVPKPVDPKKLDPWAERVKEAISEVNNKIKSESESVSDVDLFPLPKVGQTKEAYLALAKEVIGIAKKTYNETQQIEDESTVNRTKALAPYVAEVEKILNLYKNSQKDILAERLKNQISLIKEMNKEYEKLKKTFSASESLEKIKDAYADTAKALGLDLSKMDFTDAGTIKSLEDLLGDPQYAANKYALDLKKALDDFNVELGIETKQGEDERLKNKIQELFDQYDLSLELKKLNIPSDLAKSLFDVDYLDLEGLKKAVQAQEAKFIGTDMEKEYKKFLDKIDDLEEKQQLESAKRFVKFLTQNLDQTKVVLQQRGIDIAFAKKEFDEGRISAEQFAETVKNIVAQSNEEISKINIDKFKESSEYIQAMGDLTAYSKKEIQGLIKTLNDAVTANAHLFDADEVKAYIDAISKAQDELESRDVFDWGDFGRVADIIQTQKEIEDKKVDIANNKATLETQKEKLKQLEEELERLKAQKEAEAKAGVDTTETESKIAQKASDIANVNEGISQTNSKIKTNTGLLNSLGDKMKGLAGNMGNTLAIIDAIIHGINDTVQGINTLYGEIGSVMESFGEETDFSTGFGKGAMLMDSFAKSSQAAADGWDAFKSGDPVGVVVNVVKSITEIIKGINAYHDAGLEVLIQDHLEEVESLQKEYEKLEWTIDRAFSFKKYGMVAEQTKNLTKQIENTRKALAAEQSKKDPDDERIKELRSNIEETSHKVQELYDKLREEIVGSFEDLSSTLADAMIEALKNGEDALRAWGEAVDDIIANIVTKLAVQKYVEPMVDKALDKFYGQVMPNSANAEKAYQKYLKALERLQYDTSESAKVAAAKAEEEYLKLNNRALNEVPNITEQAVDGLRQDLEAVGVSFEPIAEMIAGLVGGEGVELASLTKGIQGMTEQQAEVLTAYWNSVRGYTASIDSKMDLILANMGVGAENNPMLEQMRLVANNTSAINTLLNNLVIGGHPQGGQGLKVFMD